MANKSRRRLKGRLFLLRALRLIFAIAPVLCVLLFNWHDYTDTVAETVKLGIGAIMILVIIVLKALDKLGVPRRIVVLTITFVLVVLLENVMVDIKYIVGALLLSEVIDYIVFRPAIGKVKEALLVEKTADATAGKVEELLTTYLGGRV